jgi:ribosome-associated heat shock protein Hsp15
MESDAPDGVRVDRWLLAARVFKTRSLCQEACAGGKVDVNGVAASAHKIVRVGDRLRVTTPRGRRQLVVRGVGERRLSAPDAALLYEDVTPPEPVPPAQPPGFGRMPPLARGGRPTKRDRREIERLRSRS